MKASAEAWVAAQPQTRADVFAVPWYVYAFVTAISCIYFGIQWDVSWHATIGRDTFWTPAHIAIYAGCLAAGVAALMTIAQTTFTGAEAIKAGTLRVWGLRAPLGAFICCWGSLLTLTGAPLDNWWHEAYGLDIRILSPPHVLLTFGFVTIFYGTMISVLSLLNRVEREAADVDAAILKRRRWLRALYVYAAGGLLAQGFFEIWPFMKIIYMHASVFYVAGCITLPVFLVGVARSARMRWPATATAAVYMLLWMVPVWILPLFAAEPKLGPVVQRVTHLIPFEFPLLLVVPAAAVDLLMQRAGRDSDWRLSLLLGVLFFATLLAVQWPFGTFLMSPYSQNWFFGTHYYPYTMSPQSYYVRHVFYPWDAGAASLLIYLALGLPCAILSARAGLSWGDWMRKVQR